MANSCQKCVSMAASNFVPGEGPQTPGTIVIVGEAPGRDEDDGVTKDGITTYHPFIGGSGKILRSMLHETNLNPKDVYLTNVCKCRPPDNRTPTIDEVQKCLSNFLAEELSKIQPSMIVALGATASSVLTGRDLVWRGSIIPCVLSGLTHVPVLITYHPAYLMRNRTEFSTFASDLEKLHEKHRPKTYPQEYVYEPSLQWVSDKFGDLTRLNLHTDIDIETGGEKKDALDPFRGHIIGIAFCWEPGKAFNIDFRVQGGHYWEPVKRFLESGCPIGLQNNTFDLMFMLVEQGIDLSKVNLAWDTLDAAYVIYSDSDKDLDYLRSIYTNIPPYKQAYSYKTSGIQSHSATDIARLACLDTDVTTQVRIGQQAQMSEVQKKVVKTINRADKLAVKMRHFGVPVSKEELAKLYLEWKPKVDSLRDEFERTHLINPASPKQVGEFLFKEKKLKPPRGCKTPTGYSVDIEVIKELLNNTFVTEDIEMLNLLLKFRKSARELSTNIEGMYKLINPKTGRIHPDWRPTGTDTGRWACKAPNMQNIPKHMRMVIQAEEGYELFISDYSQLELLTIALLAKDHDLANFIVSGGDIHGEVNKELKTIVPGIDRTTTKAFVFGTAYGLQANSAARLYQLPMEMVRQAQNHCYNRFPKLLDYSANNIKEYESKGYLETPFGRRKYCESPNQALNFRSQSSGFCIVQEGMFLVDDAGWHLSFQVHDELVSVEKIGERTLEEYKAIVEVPFPEWLPKFPVKVRKSHTWYEEKD